jgi:hypothetical protein
MDFSQAQREGFILAYVEFFSSQADDHEDEYTLRMRAESLLKGCAEHFRQAISHVAAKHAVIDPTKHDEFVARAVQLSQVSSYEEYEAIARRLINEFPRTTKFLEWWLRLSIARMIMKSQRVMEEDLWHSLSSTTNAQEAGHWAMYCSAGTDHSLMSGLEALYAAVDSFKMLDTAAKSRYPSMCWTSWLTPSQRGTKKSLRLRKTREAYGPRTRSHPSPLRSIG